MKIIRIKPSSRSGSGQYREIAQFDIELSPDLRIFAVRLLERPGGHRIVQGAHWGAGRTATFSPALAREITALATSTFNQIEGTSLDHQHA